MLNFNSVMVFSEDPKRLSEFYRKVFQKDPEMEENGYHGFVVGNTFLNFGPHDKVKGKNSSPERIIFNFETTDVRGEFKRIKEQGAGVVAEPYQIGEGDTWIATFEDPDGNYFQLLTPWNSEK